MSPLAEITTTGTFKEGEGMHEAITSVPGHSTGSASDCGEEKECHASPKGDAGSDEGDIVTNIGSEKIEKIETVQGEDKKEDVAQSTNDVDQLLEYLASNQLNLSGPASANLMSLLESSGYKTPETQSAEPSQSPTAHIVSPERQKAESTNNGMSWPGMAAPQSALLSGNKGTAFEGGETRQTAVLDCPKAMVGRVIGKGGETIKALQQYTGAMIQIDQSTDPTRVTIAGSRQSLQLAISMVSDIIKGRFKGFAMLRQIAISSDGLGLGHPVYVQGYGFMPPSQAMSATHSSGSVSPELLPQRVMGASGAFHRAPSPLSTGMVGLQDGQHGMVANGLGGMPDMSSLSHGFMNPRQYPAVQQQPQYGTSASQEAMLARLIQLAALEQQQQVSKAPANYQQPSSELLGQQPMAAFGGFPHQQQQPPASSMGFYSDAFQGRMHDGDQRQTSLFGSQTAMPRNPDSSYYPGQ